ncbi:MAG: DsbA family protein [Nitriliruptoraceae bacterium]
MSRSFTLAFDYLCPWARNANEHVATALRDGADFDVRFVPYSLRQGHVTGDEPDIWERSDPLKASGILALQVGITVRDTAPEAFVDAHTALFGLRHDQGGDLRDRGQLAATLDEIGLNGAAIVDAATRPAVTEQLAREHQHVASDLHVWGVPTFIGASRAVFVRILDRPEGDAARARQRVAQILDLVDNVPELHEFKQTELAH